MAFIRKKNHLQTLISEGESEHLDFKYAINDSRKIARSLSAFANTDGGILLLGVRDNGSIAGVKSEEEFYMIQAASQLYTKPNVNFETKQHNVNGLTVLEIIIPKSSDFPHYAPDADGHMRAYIRVKDENILASRIQLRVWNLQKSKLPIKIMYSESEKILLDFLSENQTISFSKYCRTAEISRFKAEKILSNLILLKIIEICYEDKNPVFKLSATV
jgi:predicted HTH transcriptional regulator